MVSRGNIENELSNLNEYIYIKAAVTLSCVRVYMYVCIPRQDLIGKAVRYIEQTIYPAAAVKLNLNSMSGVHDSALTTYNN